MILSLQPTTFSTIGGIQTYNALVCRVLNELGSTETRVLFGNDKQSDVDHATSGLPRLTLKAFEGSRTAFVAYFLWLALSRKINLALIGHVNYAPLGLLLKRLQPEIRYGVILYGVEAWGALPRLKRLALRRADFLIAISEFTKRRAVEANGLSADQIYLLPNALESTHPNDSIEQAPTAAGAGVNLLSVCRLESSEQYKGVDKVIEALPDVMRKVPDVEYVVVGGGTDLKRHKALAIKLGVADRVHFLGFVEDDDLQKCYRNCDVFVMPSDAEGFGFVFLEAMRYSKPVIAARSGGVPEVVHDRLTGRLVNYGDHEELINTLVELCLDPAQRNRLGGAGHQRLQKRFTYSHFARQLTEILWHELSVKPLSRVAYPDGSA